MIDVVSKQIDRVGWAGNCLWLITKDNYSLHLYDGFIILNGIEIETGQSLNSTLKDKLIAGTQIHKEKFLVIFDDGASLSVSSEVHETARIFKKSGNNPHYIFQNGLCFED